MSNTSHIPRTFDRLVSFDERSRAFPVRATLTPRQMSPRNCIWTLPHRLDQGTEGACVGFAWAHELAATPRVVADVTDATAFDIYREAQTRDEWPGESYSGTSVLAGAKTVKSRGFMREYRWCFNLDDLKLAVSWSGPVVLGVNWYQGMYSTDEEGYVYPYGDIIGGHAVCCYGISVRHGYFLIRNSWGRSWGIQGSCRIHFNDMTTLLANNGEACVPVGRSKTPRRSLWSRLFGWMG